MADYENRYWQSSDGLKLHYRDYAADDDRGADLPPILCIPGLTRNARDFELLAERLSARRRVIALDLRGRGESAYAKDPMSYTPATYVDDVEALLGELGLPQVIAFGTSLGGIVTMLLAQRSPQRIVGALLNDVGPQVEPAGLARIRGYVGKANSWPTWMHAARAVAEANAAAHPDHTIAEWLAMAKRLYRLTGSGRIVLDYDMKIAEPFRAPGGEAGGGPVAGAGGAAACADADRPRRAIGRAERRRGAADGRSTRACGIGEPARCRPCADARRTGRRRGDRSIAGAYRAGNRRVAEASRAA